MNKGLWNFIALASFTVTLTCVVMTFLSAAIGLQVSIPPIPIGSKTITVDLIQIGFYVSGLYVFMQAVQALTPPAKPGLETLAYVGSWIALVGFAGTLGVMGLQMGFDIGNIADLRRITSPFALVTWLLIIAIIDLTLLQWLKNRSIAREGRTVLHGTIEHGNVPVVRGEDMSPLITGDFRDCSFTTYNVDCRGKDVRITAPRTAGGPPEIEIIEPAAHAA